MIHNCLGMNVCVPQTGLVLKQQLKQHPCVKLVNFHIGSGAIRSTPPNPFVPLRQVLIGSTDSHCTSQC